ncbi:MAG TPA: hypothetical protein VFQ61_22625, partial [Polyangiaceae bacterium]|nr:hypothetical protein [Polyangiaceae bacterium]
ASWSWAAFFLYPGILVYDSNLSTGADHLAAIWAPAGLLLVLRLWTTPDLRAKALSFKAALLGALAGGAALTKYSAICAAAPLLLGLIWACIRPRWRELSTAASATKSASTFSWVPIGVGLAAFVLVTSQHWLKNWVWHGDPLYPILRKYLPAHPWHADAEAYFRAFKKGALLKPNRGALGVWQALRANVTLGFEVNDYDFHGQYPTFGYLFPITALLSFLVPSRWRVRGLAVLCMCGVTIWFATNHRDRYLQAILPWMVAVTFCALRVAWRQHGASVRAGLVLLVGSQLTTSLDVWLFPSHMAEGAHPILPLYDFVKLGMEGKYAERAQVPSAWGFADWVALGSKLPRGSKVLVHEDRLWTGLDAPVVTDEAAWQAGLHYGSLRDTRAVHQALREYGVTHIVTGHPHGDGGFHALAGELLFWDYVRNQTCPVARSGHLELHRLPSSAPERGAPERVLVMTCQASEPAGVYDLRALRSATAPPAAPFRPIDVEAVPEPIWEGVEYVVTEDECGNWETGTRAFTRLYTREKLTFWRRAATAPRPVGCKSK